MEIDEERKRIGLSMRDDSGDGRSAWKKHQRDQKARRARAWEPSRTSSETPSSAERRHHRLQILERLTLSSRLTSGANAMIASGWCVTRACALPDDHLRVAQRPRAAPTVASSPAWRALRMFP